MPCMCEISGVSGCSALCATQACGQRVDVHVFHQQGLAIAGCCNAQAAFFQPLCNQISQPRPCLVKKLNIQKALSALCNKQCCCMLRGIAWLAFKHSASCIVKVMLALAKGFLNMSIFGSILSAIFHHAKAATPDTTSPANAGAQPSAAAAAAPASAA